MRTCWIIQEPNGLHSDSSSARLAGNQIRAQLVAELASVLTEVSGDVACLNVECSRPWNPVSGPSNTNLAPSCGESRCDEGVRFGALRGEGGNFSSGGDLEELKDRLPPNYVSDYGSEWARRSCICGT